MNDKSEIVDAEFTETQIVRQVPGSISVARPPEAVLAEARKAAAALKEVIDQKPRKVEFNGQTYLEFEDWQTIARFYGVSCKVSKTEFVQYGDVKGFEARAVVLLVSNGLEISAADSMCLNDEENWGKRKKYEYIDILDEQGQKIWEFNKKARKNLPKRERKLVGEEDTPLFQLRSMAQTRACSKALRNVLAFVPVLAGYAPTPAEEMLQRGSMEAAEEVARRKIAEHEAKKAAPAAPDLTQKLQESIAATQKPPSKPVDPIWDKPIDSRPLITKAERGKKGGKAEDMLFVDYDGEKATVFDKSWFPYLKAGVQADMELQTVKLKSNGKSYVNVTAIRSVGDVKAGPDGKPALDVNRPAGAIFDEQVAHAIPPGEPDIEEYLL